MYAAPLHGPAVGRSVDRLWLERWRTRHAQAAGLLLCASITTALALGARLQPGPGAQIAVLVLAVSIFGVPHGALDLLVGRRWLAPQLGPRWWLPFHANYLALVAAVVLAWIHAPTATLAGFLTASAIHFGLGDVDRARLPTACLGRGARPRRRADRRPRPCPSSRGPPGVRVGRPRRVDDRTRHDRRDVGVVRPLRRRPGMRPVRGRPRPRRTARHALALAAALDPVRPRRAWARFAGAAFPAAAATLALGAAACAAALAHRASASLAPAAARVVFAGLAALTAPHMLLTLLASEHHAAERDRGTP